MRSGARVLVTPDTNVCVRGGTVSEGHASLIIQEWRTGLVDFALCEPILAEVADVLNRPYFVGVAGWTPEKVKQYVEELRGGSKLVAAKTLVNASPDPKDNMIFSCAIEAGADYIVSVDKRDVLSVGEYQGVKVIHPTDFVKNILQLKK